MIMIKIFCEKNAPLARFFNERSALQARLMEQNAPKA